jgi:hypothetical protein
VLGLMSMAAADQSFGSSEAVAWFAPQGFRWRLIRTSLNNKDPQSCFGECHRSHAARGSRADHNRFKGMHCHGEIKTSR